MSKSSLISAEISFLNSHANALEDLTDDLKQLDKDLHSIDYGPLTSYLGAAVGPKNDATIALQDCCKMLAQTVSNVRRYATGLVAADNSFKGLFMPGGALAQMIANAGVSPTDTSVLISTYGGDVKATVKLAVFVRISEDLQASIKKLPNGKYQVTITKIGGAGVGVSAESMMNADIMLNVSEGRTYVVNENQIAEVLANEAARAKTGVDANFVGPKPNSTTTSVGVVAEAQVNVGNFHQGEAGNVSVAHTDYANGNTTTTYSGGLKGNLAYALGGAVALQGSISITRDSSGNLIQIQSVSTASAGVTAQSPTDPDGAISGSVETDDVRVTTTTLDLRGDTSIANTLNSAAGAVPDIPVLVASLQGGIVTTQIHHLTTATGAVKVDAEAVGVTVNVSGYHDQVVSSTTSFANPQG